MSRTPLLLCIVFLTACSSAPKRRVDIAWLIRDSKRVRVSDEQGFRVAPYSRPDLRADLRRVCLGWPLPSSKVNSSYGRRWGRKHQGLDLKARTGTPVLASLPGRVIYAGDEIRGYGNVVIVKHARGLSTAYAHLDEIGVEQGSWVSGGQEIARSGATGRVTGAHLHFEVRDGDRSINPLLLLQGSKRLPAGRGDGCRTPD